MHNKSSEVFVNLMCGFLNRFMNHEHEDVIEKIKHIIGEDNLDDIKNNEDSIGTLCQIFENKLKNIGQFTLKFLMRDETNVRDNALFFCSNNATGFKKIKEAMWNVDDEYGNSFSVYRESSKIQSQANLFEIGPQTHLLAVLIQKQFRGCQNVSVKEIFKWVIEETSYLDSHARIELENLWEKGLITNYDDPESRPRRSNAWPERLLLTFADKTL